MCASGKSSKSDPRSTATRPAQKADILGQVLTPPTIAKKMCQLVLPGPPRKPVQILDPSVGPGTFPQALAALGILNENCTVTMVDIDGDMIAKTRELFAQEQCEQKLVQEDYLEMDQRGAFDCVICNPPYIRQEWIANKAHYRDLLLNRYNIHIPGTANLYVYFVAKIVEDLKPGGTFACIIYDSWTKTIFGQWLSAFLQAECEGVQVIEEKNQPFLNRMIKASIITGKRKKKANKGVQKMAQPRGTRQLDGAARAPEAKGPFRREKGFYPMDSLMATKRGLRLKQADFFLCDYSLVENIGATPFIKKIGKVKGFAIPEDHPEAALLVADGEDNPLVFAELQRRLAGAQLHPDQNKTILNWYQERPEAWYLHRRPPYGSIIFNYYLRNRPKHLY